MIAAERIAQIAARYDGADNEGDRLTASTLARLEWRKRNAGKVCDRCRETKTVDQFGTSAREPDGLNRTCKSCRNSYERNRVNG